MANIKISDMTAAASASGTQEFEVNDSGTTKKVTGAQLATLARTVSGENITLGDNDKAIFGAGSDLQVFHDGSQSIIADVGTGPLKIRASDLQFNNAGDSAQLIQATDAGAVTLFHNGSSKFATTSVGADVTGEFIADSYNETYVALSGTTPTVNCESGNMFALSTTGNTTFTFSNPPASGTGYGFILKLTAGGTHSITWPTSVDWAAATAPDDPASGETDILAFITHDGGTTWYGFRAGDAMG